MKKRLGQVDAAFLRMETTQAPMHLGCLMVFKLPPDNPQYFFTEMLDNLRSHPFMPPPFAFRLAQGALSDLAPAWEESEVDMEFHIRHSALPKPGGERELGQLVERLHSHAMDFSRPLWECHIIEGLENGRFAVYFKSHHCAIDGMGAMHLTKLWLSSDPTDMRWPGDKDIRAPKKPIEKSLARKLADVAKDARSQAKGLGQLATKLLEMSRGDGSTVRAAMDTPASVFNKPVTRQRRLGTQRLPLDRVKALSKALEVSVNDVVLGIVSGAVRRYMLENKEVSKSSLNASVPIGLSRGDGGGNAVAGFVCPLATDNDDPLARVQQIHATTMRAKDELLSMSPTALEQFTLMGLAPLIAGQITGTLSKMPPFFNFVVSNVVLTKEKLYLRGAELEAMYPMSILFDGYAMNVTVIGYSDHICVGYIGCRKAVPHLQNLAVHTREALEELEQAAGL
ncbi:MAG: WS/DGAT/MGAT family O-acyltransferase [Oceanococcus sp.]